MVCTYDNPVTMYRECWESGVLIYSYSATMLCTKRRINRNFLFFGANIGPWKSGQLVGDPKAMETKGKQNEK